MPQLAVTGRRARALLLLVGFGLLGGLALGVWRGFESARARTSDDRAALERGLRAAPDDAELHHRLAQWEQFSLAEGDLQRALAEYRQATALNPHESAYWLDLADALWLDGQSEAARDAVARALEVDPRTPRTLWRVGNFWLRTPEPERAFPYFRQVLATDPELAPLIIQAAHRTVRDPDRLRREVLPPEPAFLLTYLRQVVREGEAEAPAAARIWAALVELGKPFDPKETFFYLDFLLRTRRGEEAARAWSELGSLRLLPGAPAGARAGELLYNADLANPILNGGFDWRVDPVPHVSVSLGPGRQGEQPPAVIILFSGEDNVDYKGFYQYAVVEPNRTYRLHAWLATEGITTESGPRLEVADVYDGGRVLGRSPSIVGSVDWAPEEMVFTTGARTRLLRVGIVRLPSSRLGNQIRGTVRAAEFSLRAVGSRGGGAP